MLASFASNAVLSKARAMYGKRLTAKNYSELVNCNGVNDIASYLKHRTNYSSILSNINENDIHRGQLENVLKKKLFKDFSALGRYEVSVGEHFSEYVIIRMEIEQIMHILMLLSAQKTDEYTQSMPVFFNKHTHMELHDFSKIKDYNDFLNAISNSRYYKLLKPLAPSKKENINLTKIETTLYTYLYEKLFFIIDKYTHFKTKSEILDLFNSYIDFTNLVRIVRLKKYYNLSADYIRSSLFPFGSLKKSLIEEMLNAESAEDAFNIIKKSSIGKKLSSIEYSYPDEIPKKMRFLKCKHNIRFSVNPPVVMMSYIFLSEIELINIVTIIEGIRYNIPASEIDRMLIYTN